MATLSDAEWPDVALALIQFAERSPGTFTVVVAFLIILTVLALSLVWLMLPRAAVQMEAMYRRVRRRAQEEIKDLFSEDRDDA